ncbi:MAG: hypothetical protein IJQ81_06685 [Oscillibacter sp.]|nr:hypothetical protein [Oscillibacter sp.]
MSKYKLRRLSFRQIIPLVEKETGQKVTVATIKSDWDLCRKRWADESARSTKEAIDEAVAECEHVLAELWALYEESKKKKVRKTKKVHKTHTEINDFGVPKLGKPITPVETTSESGTVEDNQIGDVRILAEIRAWEERRDKLLGLQTAKVDITSGGKVFTGFSSVVPDVPGIVEYCARIDAERERREREENGE